MSDGTDSRLALSVAGDSKSVSIRVRNFTASLSGPISTTYQIDATLSKELRVAVKSVGSRVNAAMKSCNAVESIVQRSEASNLKSSKGEESLLATWKDIVEDFRSILKNSSKAAILGANHVKDIFAHLLPFLFDESTPVTEKQREIIAFKESVEDGMKAANNFSVTLEKIVDRISEFKTLWSKRVGHISDDLSERIAELENVIHELSESMQHAKKDMARLKLQGQLADDKARKSEMQQEVKDTRKEIGKQIRSDKEVSKHTKKITAETDGLIVVWNLLSDDVANIKNYFDLLSKGNSNDLFRARLEKLPGQYKELEISLRKYSSALAHRVEPGYKSGRSFNPFKMILG